MFWKNNFKRNISKAKATPMNSMNINVNLHLHNRVWGIDPTPIHTNKKHKKYRIKQENDL